MTYVDEKKMYTKQWGILSFTKEWKDSLSAINENDGFNVFLTATILMK